MFLEDEDQIDPDELNEQYVLVNFRPAVTKKNWRMDCGVAGYDNTFGLPPFFPTRLRFEDYIYRLWIQQAGIAAAHVDAAQNHIKNNYMRNPPKSVYGFEPDFFQENLLRIVDDVLTVIEGPIELWPTLVEIAFFEKDRHGLPELRVASQHA